ncbi:MAG: hypothetical protein MK081_06635 [Flavobacteriales bacterium]|nr:hypothetical protein [Flavobacteriales bacterium]
MDWKKRLSLLFLFLALACGIAHSQEEGDVVTESTTSSGKLEESTWENVVKDLNYGKRKKKEENEEEEEPLEPEGQEPEEDDDDWEYDFDQQFVGSVILAIVILLLSVLIIYLIMKHVREKDVKVDGSIDQVFSLDEVEENLPESDLERYLRLALESDDFRAAVRIYYLMCIQQMSELNIIEWEKEKTNYDYLLEISASEYYYDFSQLTLAFEIIWYGDAEVTKDTYEQLAPSFQRFIQQIKNGQ